MAELKFDDPQRQNLISVLFSLECVSDALTQFKDDGFKKHHESIEKCLHNLGLSPCTKSCSKFIPNVQNWCYTCMQWRQAILSHHKDRCVIGRRGVDWSKIDSSRWAKDTKEVEKCYNPEWCTKSKEEINENDISVILGKFLNCDYFAQFKFDGNLTDIRNIRNKVHHEKEIPKDYKKDSCNKMLDFIQRPEIWLYIEAQDAFKKIEIFKERNYIDIIKDRIIDQQELQRMEKRIATRWTKCYNISVFSLMLVFTAVVLPIMILITHKIIAFFLQQDISSAEWSSENLTLSLLTLIVLLLFPLVYLSIREIRQTRFYIFLEYWFIRKFLSSPETVEESSDDVIFVPREEWEARQPIKKENIPSPVGTVFIHHTGGMFAEDKQQGCDVVKYIQFVHMDSNHWDDIGYSFLIGEDGRIYVGRGWNAVGAHTFGWNRNSICFAFMGDFNVRRPNEKAIRALEKVLKYGVKEGKLSPRYTLYGHCDKRGTDSPGRHLYAIIQHFDHFHKYIEV